jgi:hypothetical protein
LKDKVGLTQSASYFEEEDGELAKQKYHKTIHTFLKRVFIVVGFY